MLEPLDASRLYRPCPAEGLKFTTTADLESLDCALGQERAERAIAFGLGIRHGGYNVFALGPEGIGKYSLARQLVDRRAKAESVPSDWCYVNNFDDPAKPKALQLPPGRGRPLAADMERLIEDLRSAVPAAFESEEYRARRQVLEQSVKDRHEHAFAQVQEHAQAQGIALVRTPVGFALAPLRDGEVLDREEFDKLPEAEQDKARQTMEALQRELEGVLQQAPRWAREARDQVRGLDREVTGFAVSHLIDDLRARYADIPAVGAFLDAVQRNVIDHVADFLPQPDGPQGEGMPDPKTLTRRFRVNVIVDRTDESGAPVVYEDQPSQPALSGRVEHQSQFGNLVTDFTLIKPGALHRANGGYLLLDARMLLTQPYAWEELKRALRAGELRIESLAQRLGFVSTVALEPEAIPLQVKVVLMGERLIYYLLSRHDPEFSELFKVAADFEDVMDRSPENDHYYACLVATIARKESLRPFAAEAVARVIEHGARLADDSEKLSSHMASICDLLREADFFAGQEGAAGAEGAPVARRHVQAAIDAQTDRLDRIRDRMMEEIDRGTILIDTDGAHVGQINGLAVYQVGRFSFGKPSRITCRVRLGRGEMVDIEREVQLGGPIHSKGVLILSSFLSARYAAERPLSLSASLVFEQSYGGVEGDSASSTELYALLSALADAPIDQSFAVTGSVDQYGRVQAIGGVNHKIEGFFDVCRSRGLTGRQGVLIPASNVKHLMLRHDVVEAVREGRFRIFAVETIDQGIEILTGRPAGERDASGQYPVGSINRLVDARLNTLARRAREAGGAAQGNHNNGRGHGRGAS